MKNKVVAMLVSLLIAFGLWVYVITTVSPGSEETYYNVPVALQNESVLTERGLMITSLNDPSLTLRLSGNRTDLTKLNSANITVVSDLSKIYQAGKHKLSYDISYPGDVPDNAITVLSHEPDTVTLVVEKRISKAVEVQIQYSGSVASGFICDKENIVLDYDKVTVTGPKSVVDRIDRAQVKVELAGKRESINDVFTYVLCDAEGEAVESELLETDVEQLQLSLKIQRVKEVDLQLTVVDGGGATQQTSQITVTPEKIRISGSDNLLASIDSITLGTVNLGELPEDTELTFPIVLPEGITNETGVNEAKVSIQFPDLLTKTFTVTALEAINVPDGMEAELITQQLEISLRGPKALVSSLRTGDVKVTVDFAGAQPGMSTMKPTVVLPEEYQDVGAVGQYSVSVTLHQQQAQQD